MRVILFGASGMVGGGVLRECLQSPRVDGVLSVGRRGLDRTDLKLTQVQCPDVADLSGVESQLVGFEACFFCLGVSSAGMSESDYTRVTHDLTISAARTLVRLNPGMTFVYVSGAGTDSSERGRSMWARVKGRTENDLLRMGFRAAYMFRPGIIEAKHGVRPRSRVYRVGYTILYPLLQLVKLVAPGSMTSTDRVGLAMIHVVDRGWPTPWISTRDINTLAR